MLTPRLRAAYRASQTRWALEDVSVTLEQGRLLGVIGRNGAGKSTLLRLVSGLGRPTRGTVNVVSDVASVLSLGDTLSPELTGRENAITAALIAGLELRAARSALPEILAFAELEGFEDAPVRSYSEGMKLRLAFGVLTVLRPQLLVLDEVLAVGDQGFQHKCMQHIEGLVAGGAAVLLASHDLGTIAERCDQVLWLDRGRVRALGAAEAVVEEYRRAMESATLRVTPAASEFDGDGDTLVLRENRFGSQEVQIVAVSVGSAASPGEVGPGDTLEIGLSLRSSEPHGEVVVSVAITRTDGDVMCVDLNTEADNVAIASVGPEPVAVQLSLDELELQPGAYFVDVGVYPTDWAHAYDYHWHAHPLTVRGPRNSSAVFQPSRRRWLVSDLDGQRRPSTGGRRS